MCSSREKGVKVDTPRDIERQKYLEWKEAQKMAMEDECEKCLEHNESCPFYDASEEYWDFEECFETWGWE